MTADAFALIPIGHTTSLGCDPVHSPDSLVGDARPRDQRSDQRDAASRQCCASRSFVIKAEWYEGPCLRFAAPLGFAGYYALAGRIDEDRVDSSRRIVFDPALPYLRELDELLINVLKNTGEVLPHALVAFLVPADLGSRRVHHEVRDLEAGFSGCLRDRTPC